MLMDYFDRYAETYQPYKTGAWCYEDGLIYRGLELLHRATGEDRWFAHILRLISPQLRDGPTLAGYAASDYNIDNIKSGSTLLYLHEVTGEARYLDYAAVLIDQLATHPRTRSGIYWHKLRYPWQVWLDGLYMGPPFQIGYGLRRGDEALIADSLTQVGRAMELTFAPATGLYAHAMDEARKQPWADPDSGQSPTAHWARALGWLAMALVDIADLVGPADFAPLKARTETLLADIADLRQPNGLWLQVIEQPDLKGNYTETSASAMFSYALLKARDLGLWSGSTDHICRTLTDFALNPRTDGTGHEMTGIVHVAGLGPFEGRYRDGSAEYYLTEPLKNDDAKGVGPLMMAIATDLAQSDLKALALAGQ